MVDNYPEAYTADNLEQILDANDSCPTIGPDELDRIIELAQQRADKRGEENALDEHQTDCLIATNWDGFAEGEFGRDNGQINQFAMGVYEEDISSGKGATLFTDTMVLQDGWLHSGDGRRSKVKHYIDDEYDNADRGEMWIPKGAQDYICIVKLSAELIHDDADASEAM
mgnify:CR=1 FL=1